MRLLGAALAALLSQPAGAAFYAAAGKTDITPDPAKDTVWLAGYGASGRKAEGVHDRLYTRALVVSDGERTVALVSLDSIGIAKRDVEDLRRRIGWGPKQYAFVAVTHSHSTPDLLGLWGRWPGKSGVDSRYDDRVKQATADLVRDLSGRLEKAELLAGEKRVEPNGLCRDVRDPQVFDPELSVVRVRRARDKAALATVVRWSCHPVTLTEDNRQISRDFPGVLCDTVEKADGGTCVYFSGSIGGHLIPDTDRKAGVEQQYADMQLLGEKMAALALGTVQEAEPAAGSGRVEFSSASVRVRVDNSRFLFFLPSLVFGHDLLDAEGRRLPRWAKYRLPLSHLLRFPLAESRRPWVETEVARVRLGGIDILGAPGELFPEVVVGGYDGSLSFGRPVVGPTNPNPPDLKHAPKPPYLRKRLGKHALVVSLANDELGYTVPEYDFQVTATRTMLPEPPGTHYSETNAIGREATRRLLDAYDALLK